MHHLAYALTGTIYKRGDGAAIGSALYLLFYFVIHSILMLLGEFSFAWWSILALFVIFIALRYVSDKLLSFI